MSDLSTFTLKVNPELWHKIRAHKPSYMTKTQFCQLLMDRT